VNEKTPRCVYCEPEHRLLDELQPGETVAEAIGRFSDEFEGLVVIEMEEAFRRQDDAAKTEPVEVTEAEYAEKLDLLPPIGLVWTRAAGSFKLMEPYIGGVHEIYARLGGRYFRFRDLVTMQHDDICAKVFHSAAYRQGREGEAAVGGSRGEDDVKGWV